MPLPASIKIVAVAALVFSLGLHWALLQTVAWAGMVISYSRDASLKQAVSMTFDGEHPCPLCKAIKKGQAEEKKQDGQQSRPGSKADLGLVWQAPHFTFAGDPERIAALNSSAPSRPDEPPKPRPRAITDGSPALA